MQVHDELIVECPDDSVELVKRILKEEMEGVAKLSVPLTVEVTSGKNWLEQE
jgi:DNA polymerase-1